MTEPFLMRALLARHGSGDGCCPARLLRGVAPDGVLRGGGGAGRLDRHRRSGWRSALNLTASVLVVTLAVSGLLLLLGRQKLVPIDTLLGLVAHAALALGVITASLVQGPQLDLMAFCSAISSPSAAPICAGSTSAVS